MGKKKNSTGLGRTLIKNRFGQRNKTDANSYLHTSELNDGYEWGRLNLQSVTEQNNLEEFLATAELAGTEFTAEKLNVKFISKESTGLPQGEELARITNLHKQHENLLCIPRRPPWTPEMSASVLDQNERQAFLDWRRTLAVVQDMEGLVMTPYEKNLDFWRQLWRVIERSDVVVQIVDARNPLLFYCSDLEAYVREVNPAKMCVVLINKADYLDTYQRDMWADYFSKRGIRTAFWSAVNEIKRQEEEAKTEKGSSLFAEGLRTGEDDNNSERDDLDEEMGEVDLDDAEERSDDTGYDEDSEGSVSIDDMNTAESLDEKKVDFEMGASKDIGGSVANQDDDIDSDAKKTVKSFQEKGIKCDDCDKLADTGNAESSRVESVSTPDNAFDVGNEFGATGGEVGNSGSTEEGTCSDKIVNSGQIYTGPELVEFLKTLHTGKKVQEGKTIVGMVGYPNVGKSSTINAILEMKKVPVSATPGRTKHFQTLYVDPTLMLCDCPGLVFPSFVTTKADLVVNGILPIDQMRDCIPPTALICSHIPRYILEKTYGILLPRPSEGEDPNRPPMAHELLNAYGAMRGYMTARGQPDGPRSSRFILKDYVNGKLLYCHPPPDIEADKFNNFVLPADHVGASGEMTSASATHIGVPVSKVDEEFFKKDFSTVHQRTAKTGGNDPNTAQPREKSWKKHNNRNKKEKLRRVYGYLDS